MVNSLDVLQIKGLIYESIVYVRIIKDSNIERYMIVFSDWIY